MHGANYQWHDSSHTRELRTESHDVTTVIAVLVALAVFALAFWPR